MGVDGWRVYTVDQIKAGTESAIAIGPFGSRMKSDRYVPTGVPVIRGTNISDTRALVGDFVFVSSETADELRSSNIFPGDLFFPHRGAIGEVGITPIVGPDRYILSTSLMKLSCNREVVEPLFIFYFFRSDRGRHELLKNASTVGTPGIGQPLASLRSISIPLPPLPEQRAIAHILGTLDDKIELSRRMNETLEAMARALFKSWFVDFDPVRAKAEGRDPGLPQPIADLFPDSFEDSEFGEIPKGWKINSVGDHMVNFDSRRVPVSGGERTKRQGRYPYHGAAGVMDHVDDYLFDGIYLLVGEDGSVVQDNGMAVTQYVWGKLWVNNHAHVLQGKDAVSTEHLYLYFHFESVVPYVTGAVQPKLSQGRMNTMPFVFAGQIVCRAFADIVQPLFASLRARADMNKTLAALRDTLLPKLISGELRVKDAERFVETQAQLAV